jgi:hypothetical protein
MIDKIIYKNESAKIECSEEFQEMVNSLPTLKEIQDAEDHYNQETEKIWQQKIEREWEELSRYLDEVGVNSKGMSLLERVKKYARL